MAAEVAGGVRRLLALWRLHARLDLAWVLQDRKTFLMYAFADIVANLAWVTTTFLLAERFSGIGVWNATDVVFLLAYSMVASGALEVVFGFNVKVISRRLGRGQFDHTLLQPQPIWLALLTEGFNLTGLASVLPGLALLVWAGRQLQVVVTPGWLALLLLNLAASCTVVLAYSVIWGSLAFWAPRAAEEVSSTALQAIDALKGFPLDGAGAGLAAGLLTLLPVGLVAWLPCRALLGLGGGPFGVLLTPLAAALFAAVALIVFRKGLRQYGRTGSQRYLSFGFRR